MASLCLGLLLLSSSEANAQHVEYVLFLNGGAPFGFGLCKGKPKGPTIWEVLFPAWRCRTSSRRYVVFPGHRHIGQWYVTTSFQRLFLTTLRGEQTGCCEQSRVCFDRVMHAFGRTAQAHRRSPRESMRVSERCRGVYGIGHPFTACLLSRIANFHVSAACSVHPPGVW